MNSSTSSRMPVMRSVGPPDAPLASAPSSLGSAPAGVASAAAGVEPASPLGPAKGDRHVCPYCGLAGARPHGPCTRCGIEDTPQTRQATRARIGPWYVLQQRNPAAPGMKWSVLLALVRKGQVTPRSVVRGPTTHQLWRLASQVKGLSREFGLCYSCGMEIDRTANQCPQCDRLQEPPANPDALLESRDSRRSAPELAEQDAGSSLTLPRGEGRPDPGILTARELAVAFKLNFEPPDAGNESAPVVSGSGADSGAVRAASESDAGAAASGAGAVNSRGGTASRVAPTAGKAKKRRRRVVRGLVILLMLSLAGAGAYVWMTPTHRATVIGLWELARAKVVEKFQQWRSVAPPTDSFSGRDVSADVASTTESQPHRDAPAAREPRASPASSPPVAMDSETALRTARRLWSEAIDAEARGDWRAAVDAYERIRQLPPDVRQTGLERRLADAKARLSP